jgi:hypothetical protein
MAPEMTVHCTMVGTVLYCPPVAHAMPPALGTTLSDWVRRSGVAVAIIGTAVAAPEGTALIWRWVIAALRVALGKVRAFLARMLPFLRRRATVHALAGSAVVRSGATATATVTPGWDPDASLESRVQRLHEQMVWVYAEIDRARQEARGGDAELRQIMDQHVGELRAAHQAHQEVHVATQRQAARVDARGVVLIGLGVIMTGIPDELAYFWPVGWIFIAGGVALSFWWAYRAWSQRRAQAQPAA